MIWPPDRRNQRAVGSFQVGLASGRTAASGIFGLVGRLAGFFGSTPNAREYPRGPGAGHLCRYRGHQCRRLAPGQLTGRCAQDLPRGFIACTIRRSSPGRSGITCSRSTRPCYGWAAGARSHSGPAGGCQGDRLLRRGSLPVGYAVSGSCSRCLAILR